MTRKLRFLPPRIHGELLTLGINISGITVSRYMPTRPPPAGSRQRWATFLRNLLHETLAIDFAVVPTATSGILYVFFVLSLELGLEKDTPEERPIEPREMGEVVAIPRVGGPQHRYSRAFRSAA